MSHSEICPVCGGTGKIRTYLDPLGFGYSTSGKTYTEKIIDVSNDIIVYNYFRKELSEVRFEKE